MTKEIRPAPLFVDAFSLAEWIFGRFGRDEGALPKSICAVMLDLLDAVTLALKGRNREEQVEIADEQLIRLRIRLRLAAEREYLTEKQLLYALERADAIGRQLGGWLRSLGFQ